MKELTFSNDGKKWDRYGAFHHIDGGLVHFDTGEVMVRANMESYYRTVYSDFGIQLVSTTEKECPNLYFDRECTDLVTKAWLTQDGQQQLAIDLEQNCAVAFRYHNWYRGKREHLPALGSHVEQASAYWSGANRMPVPLAKIQVQAPNPEYRKKVMPVLKDEVQPVITAMWRLSDASKGYQYNTHKFRAQESWLDSSGQEIIDSILAENTSDYNKTEAMRSIAQHGFRLPRAMTEVDFLYIKGGA